MKTWGILVLALTAGLSGCSQRPHAAPTAEYLVGSWVPDGVHCESDGGVTYRADGRFDIYEEAGTWRLEGDQLIYRTLSHGGTDEPLIVLKTPEEYRVRLSILSADAMTSTGPDGASLRLTRCAKR